MRDIAKPRRLPATMMRGELLALLGLHELVQDQAQALSELVLTEVPNLSSKLLRAQQSLAAALTTLEEEQERRLDL